MIKVVIVDDEIHARENLSKKLLKVSDQVQVIGEAYDVTSAFELINSLKPDVVFLDIEMPGEDGFGLLDRFETIPFDIVFVTAYNDYALKAFEYFAVAYITKPIDNDYLKSAIELLLSKKQLKVNKELLELVRQQQLSNTYSQKLTIPLISGYELVEVSEITCLESSDGYTNIKFMDGTKKTSSKRLKYYEERLDKDQFKRVHRSFLINKQRITSYNKSTGIILLDDNLSISINKNNRKTVNKLLSN